MPTIPDRFPFSFRKRFAFSLFPTRFITMIPPYSILPVEFFAAQGNKHQFCVTDTEQVHSI